MSQPPDGDLPSDYDALPADEQAAARARRAADMVRRLETLDFTAEIATAGRTYSELDEHGNVVHRHPRRLARGATPAD